MKLERRKIGKALLFAVLIATLTCVSIGTVSAAEQHYVNPGGSIQGAIDNANAGDTIIVRDGRYTENVDVNVDHLTIKSEHGYDSTVVHAANTSDHVFEVTADYVNITGFTVTDATGAASDYIYTCGIHLYQAEHCIISDNNVLNNWRGIYLVYSSNYNLIYNNYFNNTNNARDSGNNTWNITKTAGTNIIGGPYIGGNYWSNYAGKDLTEDGLGDTLVPYNSSGDIANGGDLLPLVKPSASSVFDTGTGTYPSIMGTHKGKAKSYLRVTSRLANCAPTTAAHRPTTGATTGATTQGQTVMAMDSAILLTA